MKEIVMKISHLVTTSLAMLSLAATTTTAAHAVDIIPVYDPAPAQQQYWTPSFKKQVSAACKLLSEFILGQERILLNITVGDTGGAFGTGAPDITDAYENSDTKYRAKKGKITFNIASFDTSKKEWNGNNTSLMLHEIIHCLGFSSSIKAFDKKIDKSRKLFMGANTRRVNGNEFYPLASDLSHFKRELTPPVANKVITDKVGVAPRMMEGGGQLLSIVDLAVLADLGYIIPVVGNARSAIALRFSLDTAFMSNYRQPQWGGMTSSISGLEGNDKLLVDTNESIALFGKGGNDHLVSGSEVTVMCGDDMDKFDSGIDGNDTYIITSNKPHKIMEFGANDKLGILTKLGVTAAQITALTVENLPSKTQADVDFINKSVPTYNYAAIGAAASYYNARLVKIGTLTFYCYAKAGPSGLTNDQLKTRLISNTFITD